MINIVVAHPAGELGFNICTRWSEEYQVVGLQKDVSDHALGGERLSQLSKQLKYNHEAIDVNDVGNVSELIHQLQPILFVYPARDLVENPDEHHTIELLSDCLAAHSPHTMLHVTMPYTGENEHQEALNTVHKRLASSISQKGINAEFVAYPEGLSDHNFIIDMLEYAAQRENHGGILEVDLP